MTRRPASFAGGLATLLLGTLVLVAAPVPAELTAPGEPAVRQGLTTSAVWTVEGNLSGARMGDVVAPAGDVNGDGYSDVIVSTHVSSPQGIVGAAVVYLGSASGPDTIPDWTATGSTTDGFGRSVAAAGDVNGDGYGDVIVGANTYTNNQVFEGRALVYYGSPAGLAATPAWTVESNQTDAMFGDVVATAGDVNGDGFSDVVVAASGNGTAPSGVSVYHGSVTGLSTTPAWTNPVVQADAEFGVSVACAGDVNADGFADVIVGANRWDAGHTDEGRAFVFLGSASGLNSSWNWNAEANDTGALFGTSVAGAGDVNGDGYADVVIGAPLFRNGGVAAGRAFVYAGSPTGPGAFPIWMAMSPHLGAHFGHSVATAGDVNGDGYADLVVGTHLYDNGQSDEGLARVYLGGSVAPSSAPIWSAEGDQNGAVFGASVATAGDVDGDGFSDLLVGAFNFDNGEDQEGRVFLYRGSGDAPAPGALVLERDQVLAQLGSAVAAAGDVNGDGYSDVIVGASGYDNGNSDEGAAFVHHGTASGLNPTVATTLEADQNSALLGFQNGVSGAGDVNGDGYSDVIVGAPFYDAPQSDEGIVRVHLGSPLGVQTSVWWSLELNQADAHLGSAVAGAGDVNGDGYADVIVGAEQYMNGEFWEGRALVYHGGPLGMTLGWSDESNLGSARYGHAVAGAGDVNGDGYSDVIVGAPQFSAGQSIEGRAFVYHGSPGGLGATPAWTAESNLANAEFGYSVASAGDVNGDGYSDVIVGAQFHSNGNGNEGRASLYLGSSGGLADTPAWFVESNATTAGVGMAVSSAGDVNGDGYSDVLVGFRQFSNGQTNEGRTYLYLGGAAGPDTIPDWTTESNQASAGYGSAVASAGDVDGDGFSDIVVGASGLDAPFSNEGAAYVYYGNLGQGTDRIARQARPDDTRAVALLGGSTHESSIRLKALGRTAAGRGHVRLEYEIEPLGTPFDGAGVVAGPFVDTGAPSFAGSAVPLSLVAGGLVPDSPYRWRARIRNANPFFPVTNWLTMPGNAPSETDFRTGEGVTGAPLPPALEAGLHLRLTPNPVSDGPARIDFRLALAGHARISVCDVHGRLVARPLDAVRSAGPHAVEWNAQDSRGRVGAGVYFVRLEAAGRTITRRLVRVR